MKRLLLIAAVLVLGAAKPELYKEKEDFQYARSSSDEGTKSGFYGAQRGNMGGNYERAHNMDGLAQNQMSGLVRQVEGELGDGSNTRTGSVFSSANSRGIYGSGRYDLSNLQGRNFQEGTAFGDSHSLSSLSSQHSSAYNHNDHAASATQSAGYQRVVPSRQSNDYRATQHSSHLQGAEAYHRADSSSSDIHSAGYHRQPVPYYQYPDNYGSLQQASKLHTGTGVHGSDSYAYNHDSQAASATSHTSGQESHSRYHSQSGYDGSHMNQQASDVYRVNPASRLIVATPVRVYGRPGQRVAVPVGVQTYDATHSASTADQHVNQNSEAEVLNNDDQLITIRPTSNAKHYESSYSYRKQWEKHSTSPEIVVVPVPTESPLPNENSELYDENHILNNQLQSSALNTQSAHSSSGYSGYNANTKTTSASLTNYKSAADSHHSSATALNSDALTHGAFNSADLVDNTNALGTSDTRPRSYQSSYSYHKSWERQGDPYVIQPVGGTVGEDSQRLTASTGMNRHSAHSYGHHAHNSQVDCDENGHLRVARSVPSQYDIYKQGQFNDLQNEQQQTQDIRQQTNYEQENQNDFQKIEDSQFQNIIANDGLQTQKKWDNFEDLGQQTQNKWDNLQDVGQQSQNTWDDLGQQSQNSWDNLSQQSQNSWDHLGQQSQNTWDNLGQQTQNTWDNLGQQTQNSWNNLGQQTEDRWDALRVGQSQTDFSQETQHSWNTEKLEDIGQQTQQTDGSWIGSGDLMKEFKNPWDDKQNEHPHNLNEQSQNTNNLDKTRNYQPHNAYHHPTDTNQQVGAISTQSNDDEKIERIDQSYLGSEDQAEDLTQQTQNTWISSDIIEQNTNNNQNKQIIPSFEQSDSRHQNTDNENKSHENNHPGYFNIANHDSQNRQYFYFGNNKSQNTEGGSFDNLWDKINTFEGDNNDGKEFSGLGLITKNDTTISKSIIESQHADNDQSESSYGSQTFYWRNATHFDWKENNNESNEPQNINTAVTNNYTSILKTIIESQPTEKVRTIDIGRGDIGPEDIPSDNVKSELPYNTMNTQPQTTPKPHFKEEASQTEFNNETHKNELLDTSQSSTLLQFLNNNSQQTDQTQYNREYPVETTSTKASTFVEIEKDEVTNYNQHTTNKVSVNNSQHDVNYESQFSELSQASQDFLNFEQKNFDFKNFEQHNFDQQQTNKLYKNYQNIQEHNENMHQADQETMNSNNLQIQNHHGVPSSKETQHSESEIQHGNQKWKYQPNENLRQRIDYHTQLEKNVLTNKTEFKQQNILPNDTVWGLKLEEFIHGPQEQKLAENFGENVEKDNSYTDHTLAESFKRSNEQQLVHLYKENHHLSYTGSNKSVSQKKSGHEENLRGSIEKMTEKGLPQTQVQEQQPSSQNIQEGNILPGIQLEDKDKVETPPVETTTPKTGFWNSVGNKLSNAKNKMASWFHKS